MYKIFKILFLSSKKSFIFISFIIFLSIFSFIFTGSLINSVEKYVKDTSKDFLWADLVISWRNNFLDEKENYLKQKYRLDISKKISFNSSIFLDNSPKLYKINYIEKNYPFYWNFEKVETNSSWNIYVSQKVYKDFWDKKIKILWKNYSIKWYLKQDFLASLNPFWWNEIYIDYDEKDLKSIQNLSRINYQLLVKTDNPEKVSKDNELKELRVNSEDRSNNTLNEITSRLNLFIQVFYQIIILLTFFIIVINFESYFTRIIKNIKILNILWLKNHKIIASFFILFLIIAIVSSLLSFWLVEIIFKYLSNTIWWLKADINLLYKSIFISFLIILSWSFFNLIKLKATSINSLLNENIYKKIKSYVLAYFILLFVILSLISYFSWVNILNSIAVSLIFITLIIIIIFSVKFLLKILFNRLAKHIKNNFYIYDAIRSTIKPWNLSIIIIFSSFVSVTWFLVFSTFSNWFIDFLNKTSNWKIDTFVINIDKQDLEKVKNKLKPDEYFEIIRSRILKINWKELNKHLWTKYVSWRYAREFNATTKNLDELIYKWEKLKTWKIWIDRDFASNLNLKIWDKIEFLILWVKKELTISQIRENNREWINPFFYFNFYPGDFKNFSKNYFLSYNSKDKWENFNLKFAKELWNQATFINVWDILEKIKFISKYILSFVYTILLYISIFSIITFVVSINFLKSFKESKIKNYNNFWWIKSKMKNAIFYEYFYLIIIWLLVSILVSLTISFLIFSTNDFIDFKYRFFVESIIISLGFIIVYIITYKILDRK